MKKILFSFVITVAIFGCAPNEKPFTVEKPQLHCNPTNQPMSTLNDTAKKDYSALGFELFTSEKVGDLFTGMKQEQVLKLLGEPLKKSAIEMWMADGDYHQEWQYNGLKLDISNADSTNLNINSIYFEAPCKLQTGRGIEIGSTYTETKKAYEKYFNPEESNDTILVAGTVYSGIIFNFKNKKLTRLFLGAAAE